MVIEKSATTSAILSSYSSSFLTALIEMLSKNPNKIPANVVNSALSLRYLYHSLGQDGLLFSSHYYLHHPCYRAIGCMLLVYKEG